VLHMCSPRSRKMLLKAKAAPETWSPHKLQKTHAQHAALQSAAAQACRDRQPSKAARCRAHMYVATHATYVNVRRRVLQRSWRTVSHAAKQCLPGSALLQGCSRHPQPSGETPKQPCQLLAAL
jgi:hypothetical protein